MSIFLFSFIKNFDQSINPENNQVIADVFTYCVGFVLTAVLADFYICCCQFF